MTMNQVTAILIGAGQRGMHAYASYALEHPDELRFVAVAEPDKVRRETFCALHGIPPENAFDDYGALLEKPRMANLAIVCTQDNQHAQPACLALEKGYHVLCEKPMSSDPAECMAMADTARKSGRSLTICHVLRYSPFFRTIRDLVQKGAIGRLIHTTLTEHVGYWHFAHSFTRGNWRNAARTSPMILQKSCHDMDILQWMHESPCARVSSFGSLTYFRSENAPAGSSKRCLGCAAAPDCPWDAKEIYLDRSKPYTSWLRQVVAGDADASDEAVLAALDSGGYGRCVFHCDNDVVDHQNVNLEFEDASTASFVMCAFNAPGGRTIELMGTSGQLLGDMAAGTIDVTDFLTGQARAIRLETAADGHGGSDEAMMRAVVDAVRRGEALPSSADESVMSHLMALAAEESRLTGRVVEIKDFAKKC